APRFDGKVLHRPERSGGRSLLWVVWALIAVALIVLIVLMVTGVLGQDSAAAAFTSLDLAAPDLPDPLSDRPVLKEAATCAPPKNLSTWPAWPARPPLTRPPRR